MRPHWVTLGSRTIARRGRDRILILPLHTFAGSGWMAGYSLRIDDLSRTPPGTTGLSDLALSLVSANCER